MSNNFSYLECVRALEFLSGCARLPGCSLAYSFRFKRHAHKQVSKSPYCGQGSLSVSVQLSPHPLIKQHFSKPKFTAMMSSNCQPLLYSSDNPSRGRCICAERKTTRGKGTRKRKTQQPKRVRKKWWQRGRDGRRLLSPFPSCWLSIICIEKFRCKQMQAQRRKPNTRRQQETDKVTTSQDHNFISVSSKVIVQFTVFKYGPYLPCDRTQR